MSTRLSIPNKTAIGMVFSPINNFRGLAEAIQSARSSHPLETYIQPQWRHKVTLAQTWNDGAKQAFADGCEYALVCNDDILFSPDTIDAMVDQFERHSETDKVVMVTPNNIKLQLIDPYDILAYERPPDEFTFSEHPNFSCFLIRSDFFDQVGTFDQNFDPAWYEDNDMHRRIQLLGYKAIMTTAAPMVHFGGVTTSMLDIADSSRAAAYYHEKWGGIPETHPGPPELKEKFKTPYNDPSLSPRDWRPRG
jgi:hypothetical protein